MAEREEREKTASGGSRTATRRLAHFELLEELGRGGMGVVYRAKDTRLGRQVAIKLLPAAFAGDPDRRSRFLREARAAAQLNHPNIATLYEVGEADWVPDPGDDELGGREPRKVVFLAMEYVQGQDLAPGLDGRGLSLKQTLDYGIQISDALAAAHAAGVIHRDLKPQNVRVTPDGRVKILDFGLAKMVQQGSMAEEPMLTAHGAIVGTAPYMAPEQLQGASEVDSRCDLFSFGVVLYQMLTGRLPFKAQRLVDYVKALTSQTPDPPSQSNPEVSPQLEQVVGRLLAKDPADRYDSAIQVGADLKAIARGETLDLPPSRTRAGDSLFGEVLNPFRRRWVGWLVGAVFLIALLAVWRSTRTDELASTTAPEPVKMVYLPPFENVTGDPDGDRVCRGLGLALGTAFQEVPVVVVEEEEKAENLGVLMRLEGFCQGLGEETSVLLRLVDRSNGVMVWSRVIDASAERIVPEMAGGAAQALDVAVVPEVRERLDRTPARSVTALTHYFRGLERQNRFDDEQALEEAVTQFREALRLEPDFALAHIGLSESLRQLVYQFNRGELESEASQEAHRAIELDTELIAARSLLARLLLDDGRFEDAITELQSIKESQPSNPEIHLQIAEARFRQGEIDRAIAELSQGLQSLALSSSVLWRYWNQLGAYLLESGDYDGAAGAFLQAKQLAPASVTVPIENLMGVELHRNRPEEALRWYSLLPQEHRTMRKALNLGNAYFSMKRYDEAKDLYSEAIDLQPDEPMGYASRGDALVQMGQPRSAQEDYSRAAEAIAKQLLRSPGDLSLESRQVLYWAKAGVCPRALESAMQMSQLAPQTPEFLLRFAQVHALCGPEETALELLTKTLAAGVPRGRVCLEPELAHLCSRLPSS